MIRTSENGKKLIFGPDFGTFGQIKPAFFFFQKSGSVSHWYHGQLSLCTVSEKTNDPIFRKLSDRWRKGQTDEQIDQSDFIECCLTKVKHPTK